MPTAMEREVAKLKQMTATRLSAVGTPRRGGLRRAEPIRQQGLPRQEDRPAKLLESWGANEFGDLPERARRRAMEIASDADLRLRAPTMPQTVDSGSPRESVAIQAPTHHDPRLPMPGALVRREYRGRTIVVRVLPNGCDFDGTVYRSLSAVAEAVTGANWNGYLVFGLTTDAKGPREGTR